MLAHVAVNVTDLEEAKRFYVGALELLGYRVVYEEPGRLAYLADAQGLDFGIGQRGPVGGAHVAFECGERETVDAFYAAAITAGGTDNSAWSSPAVRRQLLRGVRSRSRRQQHRSRLPPRAELRASQASPIQSRTCPGSS